MQISIVNGSVEYDGVPVLSQIQFELHDKEKIALVGRNGCGKTTLLKVLMGQLEPIQGTGEEDFGFYVTGKPTIGYMRQVAFSDENTTLYQEVLKAFSDLTDLEKRMNDALQLLQTNGSDENVKKYSRLHDEFEFSGGYTYEKECQVALRKFGFSETDFQKTLNTFSGGQRTKIALLKLLLSRPDVLLLDEPTNHLDVDGVEWLENYLKNYRNSCVVVSHDRMFLDRVVNVVYEIEYGETKRYRGNYTAFCRQKRGIYEKSLKDATAKVKEIERLQKIVERFRYKASKAAMAQAKLSQIERIGTVDMPIGCDKRTFHADFQPSEETVRKTLVIEKLAFGYDHELGNVTFTLEKGSKLGVVGSNGCGKSTFVRTLMGKIKPLSGYYSFGLHAKIGYFDQTETQSESEESVFDYFHAHFPRLTDTEVRTALGAFLLQGEDVFKRVCDLSGGEKVRLALCMILKERPNVLILDEPTNHMDIIGKETFEEMLSAYTGTLIVVSHDRYFINKICDKILAFRDGNALYFEGTYEAYETTLSAPRPPQPAQPVGASATASKSKSKPLTPEKEQIKREKHIAVLEKKISDNDEKINALTSSLSAPEICSDYVKILEIQDQIDKITQENEVLLCEWESLF